jgi:PAS domain-containing protein
MSKSAPPSIQTVPIVDTDNSARLLAIDKALHVSEIRYRRLFEAAQDGILLLNAETAQIEDVNPYLMHMSFLQNSKSKWFQRGTSHLWVRFS